MKRIGILVMGGLLALASGAAMAFDVQQGAPARTPSVESAPPASAGDLGANLSMSDAAKTPPGTEVRIPGLGRLGILPKMDFGLELLYGASDPKQPEALPENSDDVVVRGTLKRRF